MLQQSDAVFQFIFYSLSYCVPRFALCVILYTIVINKYLTIVNRKICNYIAKTLRFLGKKNIFPEKNLKSRRTCDIKWRQTACGILFELCQYMKCSDRT